MSQIYDYTKHDHPESGYNFYPIEYYQLMRDFMNQLRNTNQEFEAELILESINFFTSKINVKDNSKKICVQSTTDIIKLFNINYICLGSKEILRLLQCYDYIKNTKKASNIWIYNQIDNLGERNRFGIEENYCI